MTNFIPFFPNYYFKFLISILKFLTNINFIINFIHFKVKFIQLNQFIILK